MVLCYVPGGQIRIRELVLRGDVERIERSVASSGGIVSFAGGG